MVLNKVDRLMPEELVALKEEYPEAIFLSAHNPEHVAAMRQRLITYFETAMVDLEIFIPYDVQGAIGEIRAKMKVLSEAYDNNGLTMKVRGHVEDIDRLKTRFGL